MTIRIFGREKEFKAIVSKAKEFCKANNINFENQCVNPYNRSWDNAFCKSNFINQIYFICKNRKGNKVLRKDGDFKNVEMVEKFPFSFAI